MISTQMSTQMETVLESFAVESWKPHYLDYQKLNQLVGALRNAEKNYLDMETNLFYELDQEVQKLNNFSRIAQGFFAARIALLETRFLEFSKHPTSNPKKKRVSLEDVVSPSSSPSKRKMCSKSGPLMVDIPNYTHGSLPPTLIEEPASSPPFTPDTPEERETLQPNLIQFDILVCGRGLLHLEDYSNINFKAIEQILDGYEVATSKSGEAYLTDHVENAAFYDNPSYDDLCSQLEGLNRKLRTVLKKHQRKPGGSPEKKGQHTSGAKAICVKAESNFSEHNFSDEEGERTPHSDLAATHFCQTFVTSSNDDIPTQTRQNAEFWRQCRRLNGIQFQIPCPQKPAPQPQVTDKRYAWTRNTIIFGALMSLTAASVVYVALCSFT